MLRILITVSLLIVLVLGASIGFFNAQTVRFNYLFGEIELPLIALLIADFVLAVLVTLGVAFARMLVMRTQIRRLQSQVRGVESELKSLRNLPLGPEPR